LPDLVVSGINAGANTGRAILHSGTVGAALAGQNFGVSGLAVSVDAASGGGPGAEGWRWDTAARIAVETLPLPDSGGPERQGVSLRTPRSAGPR